jgi:photosystem II stability/assembly factor-like uncharacterized protein
MQKPKPIQWLAFSFLTILFFTECGKEKISLVLQKINVPTDNTLRTVYFSNTQNGWIFGGNTWERGIGLRTRDGGKTWQNDSLQQASLYGFGADTEGVIVATGFAGQAFESSTIDSNYHFIGQPLFYWARDIASFSIEKDGYITVGGGGWVGGTIIRVFANGTSKIDTSFKQEFNSVCFSDDSTVHAVGYGQIIRSTDGGKTWKLNAAQDDFFQAVCFPTNKIGYIAGLNGSILKTTDAGISWQKLRNGDALTTSSEPFRSIFFSDILRGYVVGNGGLFWQTADGGETWQVIKDMPEVNLLDVFANNTEGWIVGDKGLVIKFKVN